MSESEENLGEAIRAVRLDLGIENLSQFAREIGVNRINQHRYEKGELAPGAFTLVRIFKLAASSSRTEHLAGVFLTAASKAMELPPLGIAFAALLPDKATPAQAKQTLRRALALVKTAE